MAISELIGSAADNTSIADRQAERNGSEAEVPVIDSSMYLQILKSLKEGVYFVDRERTITFWNEGAERISGFSASEVVGRHCYDNILNHVDDNNLQLCLGGCPLHNTIVTGTENKASVYLQHKKGHRLPISVHTIPIIDNEQSIGAVEVFSDTDSHFQLIKDTDTEDLKVLAWRDQLTGLSNRRYMEKALDGALLILKTEGIGFGLIFVDIDYFKSFNDTYGHQTGDEVLQMVAETMAKTMKNDDVVARWGGEEFVILVRSSSPATCLTAAERLRMLVFYSFLRNDDRKLKVTISAGVTLAYPDDTPQTLLSRADKLLYTSKTAGRNRVTAK